MPDDIELLNELLKKTEGDQLDFKQEQYRLESNVQKSRFVKDIVSMANTPRSTPSYIVVGVAENKGLATEVLGVKEHHDPAEFARLVAGHVEPRPTFSYRVIGYLDKQIGLFELLPDSRVPITARETFGELAKGVI